MVFMICCTKNKKIIIFKNKNYSWSICRECCLISIDIKKKINHFSEKKNKIFNNNNEMNTYEFDNFYKKNIKTKLLKKNKICLDYGCGNGNFLMQAKKKGFKNVYGYEPNKYRRKNCKKKNLKVVGTLNEIKNKNDIIFSRNIFDYVENFPKVINFFSNNIKNNGYLFIIDKVYNNKLRKINIYQNEKESSIFRNVIMKETFIHHLNKNNFEILKLKNSFTGRIEIIAKKKKRIKSKLAGNKKVIDNFFFELKFKKIYYIKYRMISIFFLYIKKLKQVM